MLDFLKKVPLFQKLNDELLLNIAQICKQKSFKANSLLFKEKDIGSVFYIIIKGTIKIYTTSQNGEEKILSTFKSGDSFGELSLIDGKPRSASAQTLEDSVLYALTAQDFTDLMRDNFEISLGIMQELSQRIRDTNQHVHDLTFLDARTRIIKSLIMLANRHGIRKGTLIHIKMTLNYDELSQMAGVSKNELMVALRDFQEKQLLLLAPNEFTLDLSKLRG